MRKRMRKSLNKGDLAHFDLKQGVGGITDIEFIVQYLILLNAHQHPDLGMWTDNVRSLDKLKQHNILSETEAKDLLDGYYRLRGKLHHLALQERPRTVEKGLIESTVKTVETIWDKQFCLKM